MFALGFTINFIQAFNPIFTVFMIYMNGAAKVIAKVPGWFILMPLPQLLVSYLLWKHLVEIPQELIDAGLYEPEDPQNVTIPKGMVLPINIGITFFSIAVAFVTII